jgi:hypothetical protein
MMSAAMPKLMRETTLHVMSSKFNALIGSGSVHANSGTADWNDHNQIHMLH